MQLQYRRVLLNGFRFERPKLPAKMFVLSDWMQIAVAHSNSILGLPTTIGDSTKPKLAFRDNSDQCL